MIHPEFSPLMDALTGREASVGALARELDWPLDTAHYRVKKLLRLGLLRVVREEKRAGRPVKVYRAVADAFFLPYSSFTHATLEEKFLRHELQVARSLVRSYVRLLHDTFPQPGTLGPYLYRDEAGHLQEDLAAAPGKLLDLAAAFPTTTEHLRSLTLTDADHGPRRVIAAQGQAAVTLRFPAELLLDVDTPEGLERAEAALKGRG